MDVPVQVKSRFALPPSLHSIQALNRLDEANPQWWAQSSLLSLLMRMRISSRSSFEAHWESYLTSSLASLSPAKQKKITITVEVKQQPLLSELPLYWIKWEAEMKVLVVPACPPCKHLIQHPFGGSAGQWQPWIYHQTQRWQPYTDFYTNSPWQSQYCLRFHSELQLALHSHREG